MTVLTPSASNLSGTRILGVNTGGLTVRSLDKILHELYGPTA